MGRFRAVHELILHASSKWGNHAAFRHVIQGKVHEIPYEGLARLTALFGRALHARGVRFGDAVLLCADNSPEWALTCFGAFRLGAAVVPFDARARQAELRKVLQKLQPALFVLGRIQYGLLCDELPADKVVVIDELVSDIVANQLPDLPSFPLVPGDTPALIPFTSGSSADPKAVVLTHANILANAVDTALRFDVNQADRMMSILPLSHMFEFTAGLIAPLANGGTVVYSRLRGAEHLKELLKIEKISVMLGVPAVYQNILSAIEQSIKEKPLHVRAKAALARHAVLRSPMNSAKLGHKLFEEVHNQLGTNIKFWAAGGAPVPADLVHGLQSFGIPLLAGYGLTEASPIVSANTRFTNLAGSVGKPLPTVEVRIDKSDENATDGEILVRGPSVMSGYYKDKKATAEVLEDGWLHTGDIGYLDHNGYLYVTGRKKSLIVTAGGYNVHPEELEAALEKSPLIKEACVFGRQNGSGEQPFAVIVPAQQKAKVEDRMGDEISRCLSDMADYKRLSGFKLHDKNLPRTPAGKLRRQDIATAFNAVLDTKQTQVTIKEEDWSWDEVGDKVCKVISDIAERLRSTGQLRRGKLWYPPNTTLAGQLGIDSFQRLELGMRLEEEFGFEIPEDSLNDAFTVEELVSIAKFQKKRWSAKQVHDNSASPQEAEFRKALGSYERLDEGIDKHISQICGKVTVWPQGARPHVMLDIKDEPFTVAARRTLVVASRFVMQVYNELEIKGRDRLAMDPPFIVAANHCSHVDTFAIMACFPANLVRLVHPVAAADTFFVDRISSSVSANLLNALPFDRFGDYERSLQECEKVLRKGEILIIFPEGTRSRDGRMGPFRAGFARLAISAGCPIIPAHIKGSHSVLPKGAKIPRSEKLSVSFGIPIYPPPGPADVAHCLELNNKVQSAVQELAQAD